MSLANVSWLFETNALKIAPAEKPFWYTSGLIGPYYINTSSSAAEPTNQRKSSPS